MSMTPHLQPGHSRRSTPPGPKVWLAATAAAAMMAMAAPVWAQSGTSSSTTNSTSGPNAGATGMMGGTAAPQASRGGPKTAAERDAAKDAKFMVALARANMAEVQASQVALTNAQSDETRRYAQQMIDEHTAALTELQTLASSKGVTLPTQLSPNRKTELAVMQSMNGSRFDNQYQKRTGVRDHAMTVKLLQTIQKEGKDPDLLAMANKMLPAVQQHLTAAHSLRAQKQ